MSSQTGKQLVTNVNYYKKNKGVDVYVSKVRTWDKGVYVVNMVVVDAHVSGGLVSFTTWTGKTYTMRTVDTAEVYINYVNR